MIDYVVYGKIIIDDIRLRSGERIHALLGGGGPQAAFGARVWSDSVGILTRSGSNMDESHVEALHDLDIDLAGWRRFPGIPTPRTLMAYDVDEYLAGGLLTTQENWTRLLREPLDLPASYHRPKVIHLITEFPQEPMVETALGLRQGGTLVSLEPLAGGATDWTAMLALVRRVQIVTPDWPTASRIADSAEPRDVLRHWSSLGPELVAVRHGARGSYVWSRHADEAWHVPAVPAEVVDPTGAGNAYGGGLCVGWTESGDARLAGAYGAISASLLLSHVGLPRMSRDVRQEAWAKLDGAITAVHRL